jgi:hypothetical protein
MGVHVLHVFARKPAQKNTGLGQIDNMPQRASIRANANADGEQKRPRKRPET